MTKEELLHAYTAVLLKRALAEPAEVYGMKPGETLDVFCGRVAKNMINAVIFESRRDIRWDVLKANPSMRKAAAEFGIKRSKDLRELAKDWEVFRE